MKTHEEHIKGGYFEKHCHKCALFLVKYVMVGTIIKIKHCDCKECQKDFQESIRKFRNDGDAVTK